MSIYKQAKKRIVRSETNLSEQGTYNRSYRTALTPPLPPSGINTSKSLTVHSAVAPWLLTYISVPTLSEDHTRFAGLVPGSCVRKIRRYQSPVCISKIDYLQTAPVIYLPLIYTYTDILHGPF